MKAPQIAPSILAANFLRLGEQIAEAEAGGADRFHLDIMDGHFVPNISFGPGIVAAARHATELPLDVHLMIESPERYLDAFARAGAQSISVHIESCPHLHRTLEQIRGLGCSAGVALNPATPVHALTELSGMIDLVLVMSVNPGFGGQSYIASSTEKIRRIVAWRGGNRAGGPGIHVDGGIDSATAPLAAAAGADVLIAGSAVFGGDQPVATNIAAICAAAAVDC